MIVSDESWLWFLTSDDKLLWQIAAEYSGPCEASTKRAFFENSERLNWLKVPKLDTKFDCYS